MFRIQKRENKKQEDAEREKLEAERKKIEAEVWQMVNDELRDEIDRYKGERKLLIGKYTDLEKTFDSERVAWNKEKKFLEATIENLKEQLAELTSQLKSVKKRTDQLEKKTGPLHP